MQYICLDVGDKRVGIAHGDGNIAFPLFTLPRVEIISFLKKYSQEHIDLQMVIVGLPYDLYQQHTKQLEKTKEFIKKLQTIFRNINIQGYDERYSSIIAEKISIGHCDEIAAQIILESFFIYIKNNK